MAVLSRRSCAFCDIVTGRQRTSLVFQDADTLAFLDLRQFHPGHTLVIPREHVRDIRAVDDKTALALVATVAYVARAVATVFPADGLSVWHSAGEGAGQEVPYLHFHVHPRRIGDDVLRVYPAAPPLPPRKDLDAWASRLRQALLKPARSSRLIPLIASKRMRPARVGRSTTARLRS